jgi:DNA-binding transcriptional LysR family regulator
MNLAAVDLNLLVAFEALLAERNVTRAGQRIGLGQPAMSAALSRLRGVFNDPLLVRVPGASMRITPKAQALQGPVGEILARVRSVLDAEATFDPAEARAVFRIATSDHPATMVIPPLVQVVARAAPGIDLRLVSLDKRNAFDRLDRGEVDLLIGSFRNVPKRIRSRRLYMDHYVCIAHQGHPALRDLTPAAYAAASHVLMTLAADDRGIVDEALARLGLRRRVAVTVADFHLIPRIVERTGMLGHLPGRIAADLVRGGAIEIRTPPLDLPPWNVDLFWSGTSDAEPVARWLRERLLDIGRAIETGLPDDATASSPGRGGPANPAVRPIHGGAA